MAPAGTRTDERVRVAWDTHKDRLWRAVLAWSGDPDVASEAVAEAFAQALRRGDAIDDVGRWAWRAAFRIAGGLLADRRRTEPVDGLALADPAAWPDEVAALLAALDRLPEADRAVVVLAYVGGWPAADIADLLGSTAGAVRVRLHRARRRLREDLEVRDA
jgi:RNA polymerase sigma-70 factor (ECF subfamily)